MKLHTEKKQGKLDETLSHGQPEFNFELWARQVRPQLLASIQKRGIR
jgi:hypothetical protein